jgi:beta-glucosidase
VARTGTRARLARPPKELKGFAKVSLAPGQTRTVGLTLDMRALAYFDDARAAWVAAAGPFEVLVGRSSRDIRARATFTLSADWLQPVAPPRPVECEDRIRPGVIATR